MNYTLTHGKYIYGLLHTLVIHFVRNNFKHLSAEEKERKLVEASTSVIDNLHLLEDDLWEKYREREKYFFQPDVQQHIREHCQKLGLDIEQLWGAAVLCAELAPWFVSDSYPIRRPSLNECAKEALSLPQEQLQSITLSYKGADGKPRNIVYEIGHVHPLDRAPILEQMHHLLSYIAASDLISYKVPAIEWKPKHGNNSDEVTKLAAFTRAMRMVMCKFRTNKKEGNKMKLIAALAHVMGYGQLEEEKFLTGEYMIRKGKMLPFDSGEALRSLIKNKRADARCPWWAGLFQSPKEEPEARAEAER